ncbi:MAG TPA: globin domain-containing protein [Streptosporangiaceae bacterium]|jgi:NAD(P)H-flavin reductase|nr:globin domain-containing protein [Streptosporangiaceae bacterium]
MAIALNRFPEVPEGRNSARETPSPQARLQATGTESTAAPGWCTPSTSGTAVPAGPAISAVQHGTASPAAAAGQPGGHGGGGFAARLPGETPAQLNSRLLRKSISQLEPDSEHVMAYFFATLFLRNPELRPMFPVAMDMPRRRVFGALTRYVWSCDHPEALARWLSELAREHRKYGVTERHYRPFCEALLATIEVFSGRAWNPEMKAAWESALSYMATIMTDAAHGARDEPAWMLAEVAGHELRRPDLAVLRLRPDAPGPLPYQPGQHISVQVPRWPRVWREYSIANAPRADASLLLHVRAVPGGRVSTALVHHTRVGDTVLVGRARGDMTPDVISSRAVVCVAGGTGLAPVKALAEALARLGQPLAPASVRVLAGARWADDLYDLPDLERLAGCCPFLEVIPVVSDEPGYRGLRGTLPEVTARHLAPETGDVFISGPPAMVTATAAAVAERAPGARIHFDPPARAAGCGQVDLPGRLYPRGRPARPGRTAAAGPARGTAADSPAAR